MLSIATLHAVDYYCDAVSEPFGYYQGTGSAGSKEGDPAGIWTGKLADRFFGRGAAVERAQFASLFFGFDPETGAALTKTADRLGFDCWLAEQAAQNPKVSEDERRTAKADLKRLKGLLLARDGDDSHRHHRPGIDLTFSAPKDFSLLVGAASPAERQKLLAAWRRSVKATLETAEARYAKTRLRDESGRLVKERIAGSAVAMFEHIAARPVGDCPPDPDVHLHCVMFSPVWCHDEKARALFSNDLRLNLKVLDAEARARLAQELAGMGYALVEDRQKNCVSFRLAGVKPEERAKYSKRRGEVLDAMAAGEFQNSAVAAIGTRQEKGDWTRAEALAAWQGEFAAIGFCAEHLKQATAETAPRARSDQEIIAQLLSMKSYFSARELRQALWEEAQFAQVPDGWELGHWIDARANQLLKSPDLLEAQLPDGSTASRQRTAAGDEEPVFTTRSLIRREFALDEQVDRLGKRSSHRIDWQKAKAIVAAQERAKTLEAKAEAEKKGCPLPADFCWAYREDQVAAIAKILDGPDIGYIQAFAGTGKTTAAAAMIEVYRSQGRKVVALAPSNKAAGQLSEDCKLEGDDKALTVDAFLLSKSKERVDAGTVIFVDEASMLSFDHAEALVSLAQERGAKIVFQGDKQQLPSVGRGRFFANCIEKRLGAEAAELTVITRQKADWAKVATDAAARGDFAKTLALLDEHGAVHTEGSDEAVLDRLAADHVADPRPASQRLIVASRNADVAALNVRIRSALVASEEIEDGLPCWAGKEQKRLMKVGKGDRIIFTDTLKQGRTKVAANGALGTVEAVIPTKNGVRVRVLLDGQRLPVEFETADFAAFQHAYAISIHKSQGATVEAARYLFSEFVSSELAYVAMSRHRSTFGLYCREDQKQDLQRWMGKGMEKLDARDLVSANALNEAAVALRKRDESLSASLRSFLSKRLPLIVRAAARPFLPTWPALAIVPFHPRIGKCLRQLQTHRQKLTEHLARISAPVPASTQPLAVIADPMTMSLPDPMPPEEIRRLKFR